MTPEKLLNKSNSKLLNRKIYAFIKSYSSEDLKYLNKEELELWNSQKRYLRNGENWVMGRVTAKHSIAQCLGLHPNSIKDINIKNKANGAPYYNRLIDQVLCFSISHCKSVGFSCSSLEFESIGCDIERVKIRHFKFPNYFLSEFERNLWINGANPEDLHTLLTIAWSCKEACYKCLSSNNQIIDTVYDIQIHTLFFSENKFSFYFKNKQGIGYWDKYNGFVLSVAVLP